ncbi:hypothetical protein CR513_50080, partial [Mucuna pruriens]
MHSKPLGLNLGQNRGHERCNPLSSKEGFLKRRKNDNHWRSSSTLYELEVVDLCLVPDVGLHANFKTPEFDKYKGSSCPRDSLTGTTLSWYVNLKRGHIKTWRDLVEAFLKRYKYNEDMTLDFSQLQNMLKKE